MDLRLRANDDLYAAAPGARSFMTVSGHDASSLVPLGSRARTPARCFPGWWQGGHLLDSYLGDHLGSYVGPSSAARFSRPVEPIAREAVHAHVLLVGQTARWSGLGLLTRGQRQPAACGTNHIRSRASAQAVPRTCRRG
eukprot:scaffold2191_cov392-Prasinococcus_capsulatus_cf.AAC.14